MTTFGAVVVGYRAAKAEKSRRRAESAALPVLRRIAVRIADSAFLIGALGMLVAAAWTWDIHAGLAAAGVALAVLDFEFKG
jgi:hypothetical protein